MILIFLLSMGLKADVYGSDVTKVVSGMKECLPTLRSAVTQIEAQNLEIDNLKLEVYDLKMKLLNKKAHP